MKTAIVSGAIANKPNNGGEAWVRLSWARGMQRLGWRVYFLEEVAGELSDESLKYFTDVTREFGLDHAGLIHCGGTYGLSEKEIEGLAREAALLINISGNLTCAVVMERVAARAYIDIDPGFTQFWHAEGNRGARLAGHTHYFTIAENIGRDDCAIPAGGVNWKTIRQPVVLEDWPVMGMPQRMRFTTVASWRGSFGAIEHRGKKYGAKAHEFRKFMELPRKTGKEFEIALDIHDGDARDANALRENGWKLVNPRDVASTPGAFREYVQQSAAEFSVAQGVYVETNSGWFSDRTVRYLASGKPALVQETGFSRHVPSGKGLIGFSNTQEAAAGAEEIARNYSEHSRAAREIAVNYFDSDKVLRGLLNEVGVS